MCSIESACVRVAAAAFAAWLVAGSAAAQEPAAPETRAGIIEQAQAAKRAATHPYEPGKAEAFFDTVEDVFLSGRVHLHPFFESAYAGGGFTLGAGYARYVGAYTVADVRGSITPSGYKRIEAALLASNLFNHRGSFSAIAGWREATQVGFFGIGAAGTSVDDRANYSFEQPYARFALELRPARNAFVLGGGLDVEQWKQGPGSGAAPSIEEVYAPGTLPGLGEQPTYVHSSGTIGLDFRASPGYARRGGYYAIEFHDYRDGDKRFGFRRTDYEIVQHVPLLRETWVLSLHGRVELANAADGQSIPFFMLPSLGGGSSLRGFSSWRFRDRNSLLLQAEWRVMANRFIDMALFYDAGRVSDSRKDLTSGPLKSDYGLGFRFHRAIATPLRIELARSNEGLSLVFSAKAAF